MTERDTLLFPERRVHGAFPVTDAHGNPVARVTATWDGGRFSVTDHRRRPDVRRRHVALVADRQVAGDRRTRSATAHGDRQAAAQHGRRAPRARQ